MTEVPDLFAALEKAIDKAREIRREADELGGKTAQQPKPPRPTPDLSVGDLTLSTSVRMQFCRMCDRAIHAGAPLAAHYAAGSGSSAVADYYHPTCLPKGVLP